MEEKINIVMGKVVPYLIGHLKVKKEIIKPESHLVNDLGLDSFDLFGLYFFLLFKFGVDPKDSDIDQVHTLEELCQVFAKLI